MLFRIALRALCLGYYTPREKEGYGKKRKKVYSEYMIWMKLPSP